MLQIVECPRDAMQGIQTFIPTEKKVHYLNLLLKVGFHTLDFGSFVSPKAIPQMRDTHEVVKQLHSSTATKLLAIVANERGAVEACQYKQIRYLGFPLSVSETFQQRNTNKSIEDALLVVERIQQLCIEKGKELVVYISMGFGNPYSDPYSPELVCRLIEKLQGMQIGIVSLADTIGSASVHDIEALYSLASRLFPGMTLGVHLHARREEVKEKVQAAYAAGCRRFDGALRGFGGCPMAKDELVGNLDTELLLAALREIKAPVPPLNEEALEEAKRYSLEIF
ncbi:hydroxymethylglutaryl-CoA lyase [Thermonema rossianum]|jgi:hydroxymethylglutaryl-CoA lyase|uniref:hydroxymethylglutaryl-CoA lyase n=1 Tax=Thermonema rossianum TaxID=55505 RepID=UPI000570C88C|nr:hydroxymethylglutaryl-CoA lyase [Thermonema rossianum]